MTKTGRKKNKSILQFNFLSWIKVFSLTSSLTSVTRNSLVSKKVAINNAAQNYPYSMNKCRQKYIEKGELTLLTLLNTHLFLKW